jgi:hypothetical protein
MANTAKRKRKVTVKKMIKKRAAVPSIAGLTQSEATTLQDFFAAMQDQVVPEIVREEEERRVLAAESRRWPLKS